MKPLSLKVGLQKPPFWQVLAGIHYTLSLTFVRVTGLPHWQAHHVVENLSVDASRRPAWLIATCLCPSLLTVHERTLYYNAIHGLVASPSMIPDTLLALSSMQTFHFEYVIAIAV